MIVANTSIASVAPPLSFAEKDASPVVKCLRSLAAVLALGAQNNDVLAIMNRGIKTGSAMCGVLIGFKPTNGLTSTTLLQWSMERRIRLHR